MEKTINELLKCTFSHMDNTPIPEKILRGFKIFLIIIDLIIIIYTILIFYIIVNNVSTYGAVKVINNTNNESNIDALSMSGKQNVNFLYSDWANMVFKVILNPSYMTISFDDCISYDRHTFYSVSSYWIWRNNPEFRYWHFSNTTYCIRAELLVDPNPLYRNVVYLMANETSRNMIDLIQPITLDCFDSPIYITDHANISNNIELVFSLIYIIIIFGIGVADLVIGIVRKPSISITICLFIFPLIFTPGTLLYLENSISFMKNGTCVEQYSSALDIGIVTSVSIVLLLLLSLMWCNYKTGELSEKKGIFTCCLCSQVSTVTILISYGLFFTAYSGTTLSINGTNIAVDFIFVLLELIAGIIGLIIIIVEKKCSSC